MRRRTRLLAAVLVLSGVSLLHGTAPFVEKTVFDDEVRFLFVAGLEGTGHHTIGAMLRRVGSEGLVRKDSELTSAIFRDGKTIPYGMSVLGEENRLETKLRKREGAPEGDAAAMHDSAGKRLRQRQSDFVAMLKNAMRTAKRPALIVLNTFQDVGVRQAGMISYPNYGGPHRTIHRPDLYDIAAAAETARVDLRIVVLQRGAREILTSTTVHREFATTSRGARYLASNAAALSAQLRRVDRRFFVCSEQAEMLGMVGTYRERNRLWAEILGPFMHPALDAQSAMQITSRMKKGRSGRTSSDMLGLADPSSGVNVFVDHLHRYVQDLNDTCRG